MFQILMRVTPESDWKPYASLISTKEDAESMAKFLESMNTGYQFRLEEMS